MPHTLLWWAMARYELAANSRKSADKSIADGVALFKKYVSFELTCEFEYKTTRAEAEVFGEILGNRAPPRVRNIGAHHVASADVGAITPPRLSLALGVITWQL
jgi:hypothetical protein